MGDGGDNPGANCSAKGEACKMKLTSLITTTAAAAVILTTGCKKDESKDVELGNPAEAAATVTGMAAPTSNDPNEVVASVDKNKMLRSELDKTVSALMKSQNVPAEQVEEARVFFEKNAVRSFILKTMVLEEAKRQNLQVTDEDRKEQMDKLSENLAKQGKTVEQFFNESPLGKEALEKELAEGLIIDKLLQSTVIDKIEITDAEVEGELNKIKTHNAEVVERNSKLDETNKENRKKILDLKKQLDEGADFAKLAEENSDCPSRDRGGSLGEFTRGQMVKPFEDAAFTQELNKVGDIIETDFGYHLILVTGKNPAVEAVGDAPAKPESVTASHILVSMAKKENMQPIMEASEMREMMKRQRSQEAIQGYLQNLQENTSIETIYPDVIQ